MAGLWGTERFGLADVRALKALEGLDGIVKCASYKFVEERGTWSAEKARLEKLVSLASVTRHAAAAVLCLQLPCKKGRVLRGPEGVQRHQHLPCT